MTFYFRCLHTEETNNASGLGIGHCHCGGAAPKSDLGWGLRCRERDSLGGTSLYGALWCIHCGRMVQYSNNLVRAIYELISQALRMNPTNVRGFHRSKDSAPLHSKSVRNHENQNANPRDAHRVVYEEKTPNSRTTPKQS